MPRPLVALPIAVVVQGSSHASRHSARVEEGHEASQLLPHHVELPQRPHASQQRARGPEHGAREQAFEEFLAGQGDRVHAEVPVLEHAGGNDHRVVAPVAELAVEPPEQLAEAEPFGHVRRGGLTTPGTAAALGRELVNPAAEKQEAEEIR